MLSFFALAACGKKAPPEPPLPQPPKKAKGYPLKGEGHYIISGNRIILYWSFPVKVERSAVYLEGKKLTETKENSFVYTGEIKKGLTFRVVGIKGEKPVAEVLIKVKP